MKAAPLPYSKACDLQGDTTALAPFYNQLDSIPDVLANQHPIRRWEYAMTLRTIQGWLDAEKAALAKATIKACDDVGYPGAVVESIERVTPLSICDVGGGGSNFWKALIAHTSEDIVLVDPAPTGTPGEPGQYLSIPGTIEQYAANTLPLGRFDILTCISVIEHVEQVRPFLRACHMLLKSGGLLALTTDYCDSEGPDIYHFHWMRKRIYNADLIRKLLVSAREVGFRSFGEADWSYPGAMVYDYSVASIALVKK